MDKSFDLTPLVDSLSNSFARRLGLNRRGFIHLLQACHFEEGMLQFQGRRTQCDQLLELCRPVLDQLCQGPEEGWLRFCYETLAAGLFPDPCHCQAAGGDGVLPPDSGVALGPGAVILPL